MAPALGVPAARLSPCLRVAIVVNHADVCASGTTDAILRAIWTDD